MSIDVALGPHRVHYLSMRNAETGSMLHTNRNVTFTAEDTHAVLMIIGGERLWFPRTAAEAAVDEDEGETVCRVVQL